MILRTLIAATCLLLAITVFVHELRPKPLSELATSTLAKTPVAQAFQLHNLVTVCVHEHPRYVSETGEVTFGEPLDYKLVARIELIRPDGKLELNAQRVIRVDDEEIETILTGTASPADIAPDGTVSSNKLANLSITRRTSGEVQRARDFSTQELLLAGQLLFLFF